MYYNSLILPDGRQLPDGNAAISHVSLRRQVVQTQQLLPGGVCPAVLEVKLLDPNGKIALTAGDRVRLLRVDEAGNARKTGEFILEKPERVGAEVLVLTGYDAVTKLDIDMTQWLAGLDGWPYTLAEFAHMVANRCGMTLTAEAMPNGDLEVPQFAAIVTGRQLMRWICQACCRFCRATAEGNLELAWFSDSGVTLAPTGDRFYYRGALRYADYSTAPIDGVQLRLADGKSSYLWPDNGAKNPWIITANPMLSEVSERMEGALNVIAEQLQGLEYTPCEVTIPANEGLSAGQFVNVQTPGGAVIRACILESDRSGARDTLTGQGSKTLSTAVSAQDKAALEALNAAVSAVKNQTQEDVFNILTDNGALQGLFMKDGQLYIHASYLVTGVLRSADGKTFYLDLDNGILKGSFQEFTVAGKSVDEIAKEKADAAEQAAKDAAAEGTQAAVDGLDNKLNQNEVFNRLTDNGAIRGLFMKDGQLYINADFLATGVIKSADGTVQLDLANNTVTINGTRDGYKTQIVLSSSGLSAYGESSTGEMEHVLEFGFGVGGKPTTIMNNAWSESMGMAIAAASGIFSLGTTAAWTKIFGSDIDITPIGDLKIMGKTAYWKENADGTFSLAGR